MDHHAAITPNLYDRFFLHLDRVQSSATVHYFLALSAPLDPERLRTALAAALAEFPILRTRTTAGPKRYVRELIPDAVVPVQEATTAAEVARFVNEWLPLEAAPPLKLLLTQVPGERPGLVAAVHHSVADGQGGFYFLERLAAHYAGAAPAPTGHAGPRSYKSYLRRLGPRGVYEVAARSLALVLPADASSPRGKRQACATFMDGPAPARASVAWALLALDAAQTQALRDRARELGGTLSDVLVAAALVAGQRVWPAAELPIQVLMAVSLREGPPADASNRTGGALFRVAGSACGTFQEALQALLPQSARARQAGRQEAVVGALARGLVSVLPPAKGSQAAASAFARPDNRINTLLVSNVGVLPLERFGDVAVEGAAFLAPHTTPPGLGLYVATTGGRLTVAVAHTPEAIQEDHARAFRDGLAGELTPLMGGAPAPRWGEVFRP